MEQGPRPTQKPKRNLRRGCDHGSSLAPVPFHFALLLGLVTAVVILIEEAHHPQNIWIVNIFWPVAALVGTAVTIWVYFRYGRLTILEAAKKAKRRTPTTRISWRKEQR